MGKGHVPIRTCISCGTKRFKRDLLRLVLDGTGKLVWDGRKQMPGRGAYVCQDRRCIERFHRFKRIGRAFQGRKVISMGDDRPFGLSG